MYHLVSLAAKAALVAATSLSGHTSATAPYTVQPGDTLGSIAAASGMTWQAVYAANETVIGDNPDMIYPGERLRLPGQSAAGDDAGSGQAAAGGTGGAPSGIPSSFFACLHYREATDGQASSNQFGIMPSTWSAYGFPGSPYSASYGEQVAAFDTIYASVGASGWSPYDGC